MCEYKVVLLKDIKKALEDTVRNCLITYFNTVNRDNMDWSIVMLYQEAAMKEISKYFMSHFKDIIKEYAMQIIRETCIEVIEKRGDKNDDMSSISNGENR